MKVKSIYIRLENLEENQVVDYDIYYADESTSNRYLASKNYFQDLEKTKYATIALSGNCKNLEINIRNSDVKIAEVAINASIPFEINLPRIIGIILIVLVIHSLKTREFWKEPYHIKNFKQNLVLVLIIDIGILGIFYINNGCSNHEKDMYSDNLVKALSKGEVAISDTPDTTKLEELNDPYDAVERGNLKRGEDYIWDAAYFNHQYYVYFGAVPAILLMVPYHLITKKWMSSAVATLIFSILSIPVLANITKKVFQKYFKELPFIYLALSSFMMIFGTMLIWINVAPRFYELVTVAGFFFATFGFLLVFESEREDGEVNYRKIFWGCLSLATAVGCRPTQIFASLLIVPILLRILKREIKVQSEENSSRKKNILKLIISVVTPYLVVAVLIMRYNYLRFGNPLEFGEKYQLTVNNMKRIAVRWSLLPTGILCNLFGLPTFQGFFPFLYGNGNLIDTFGYYYIEDMPGGVFWIAPIAFFCFGIGKVWKNSQNKELKRLIASLLCVGLIFVVFISLKAGSTGRYLLDFAWLFMLCGILIFMEILQNLKTEEGKMVLGKVFHVIVCFTVIFHLLSGFCTIGGKNSMRQNSPKQYFEAEYTVMILK